MAAILAVIVFWLLWIGKSLLQPILISIISVLILQKATRALGSLPGIGALPDWTIRLIVLLLFILAILVFGLITINTAREIAADLPSYEANMQALVSSILTLIGREGSIDLAGIYERTIGQVELSALIGPVLASLASLGGTLVLVVIYASFMMAEQGSFQRKISHIFQDPEQAENTRQILDTINTQVSDYLSVKTLINAILAAISFGILWLMDIEYALFWALTIGVLNYIPYVGSMLGVVFPVAFSIVQFGSITTTLLTGALLIAAQMWVGNALEPRMIGRKLNMSPFVVLVALSLFSALWGIAGAILAIPITSIMAVVLGAFPSTRFLAILLAEDIHSEGASGET